MRKTIHRLWALSLTAALAWPAGLSAEISGLSPANRISQSSVLSPRNSSFGSQALAQQETSSEYPIIAFNRRTLFKGLGVAGMSLLEESLPLPAQTSSEKVWPPFPWTIRPSLEPVQIPPDIDAQVKARMARANQNPLTAMTEALAAFNQEVAPEIKERELIAFIQLSVEASRGPYPLQVKGQILQTLLQTFVDERGLWLWNQEELLNRIYEAIWSQNYTRFRMMYDYHPVAPADILWLNTLVGNPQQIPVLDPATHDYIRQLQDAGFHLSYPNYNIAIGWSRRPPAEAAAIVTTAAQVVSAVGGDRFRTPQALLALDNLSRSGAGLAQSLLFQPGAAQFARQVDTLYADRSVQLNDLIQLLPYRNLPGMKTVLADPDRFRQALVSPGSQLISLVNLAQQSFRLEMVNLLERQYGYKLAAVDFFALNQFRSLQDLEDHLERAKEVFRGLPPMTGTGLTAIVNLANVPQAGRDMLHRLFEASPVPPTGEVLQQWVAIGQAWAAMLPAYQMTPEGFWKRVEELKALGWQPGSDTQPGFLWSWLMPQAPLETARALYRDMGWKMQSTHEIRAFQSLGTARLADIRRLPLQARANMYFRLPGDFLASVSSNPGLWDFFIELNQKGYLSGFLFAASNPSEWQSKSDLLYFLLGGLRADNPARIGAALDRLQAISKDRVIDILVARGMSRQSQIRLLGGQVVTQNTIIQQWSPWLENNFLAQARTLQERTGYRMTTLDTVPQLMSLAADEIRIANAIEIRDRTHTTLTAALAPIIRDPHLKRLYEVQPTQDLLKELTAKGYRWNAADTEFLYHLGQRRAWRRRIARMQTVSPDLHELKFAYLEEQLNRLELREEIRRNVREDFANLYTELGGLFAFKQNGDLRLVPLPSLYDRSQDAYLNSNYQLRPFDGANMRWFAGRFFAFYHNHAIADLSLVTLASTADRAAGRGLTDVVGLSILIAATPAPEGRLNVQAFTADSDQKTAREFQWTEPPEPLDLVHLFRKMWRKLEPSPRRKDISGRPRSA